MGRTPCCLRVKGEKKGPWTPEEDLRLNKYIEVYGEGQWRTLPQKAGLDRCEKGCRLRWMNYLRPNVKRGNISLEEEELIIRLHKLLGNSRSLIAGRVPGRTDNEIKNYWNTHLSKRFNKERKPNSNQYSAKPKNPNSTSSLEKQKDKSEAQYFQVVEKDNETEPGTTFAPEFELQHHNCYYNLINPSLENQGEIWSNLDPTVEAWNGDIDGSWAQLGSVDMSASPCLLELSDSMRRPALWRLDFDGFGGDGNDSGFQNQHVENINNSGFDLCPLPQSYFSDFMDQEQQGLASIADFGTIHMQQEILMALPTGQMELIVDHYDGTREISSWMRSCESDLICTRHCWL